MPDRIQDVLQEGLKRYFPPEVLAHFASRKVGIIGCGGLGSNCALMLARSGFRKFVLADGDTVDASNLNRQIYFPCHLGQNKAAALKHILQELSFSFDIGIYEDFYNPETCPSLFQSCDYLIEAVDDAEMKCQVLDSFSSSGCWIISGSGMGSLFSLDDIGSRRLGEKVIIAGDNYSEVNETCSPLAPGVITVAARQAHEVLKLAAREVGWKGGA